MFGICLKKAIKVDKKARQGLWEVLPGKVWDISFYTQLL